ncbi:hypothetical protein [Paraclostridium sordellii]|uniref:hypothetical protein n=1 Tax=Paraclostridium sordellii TaxID=1505 RepID=UPI0013E00662|nr:hypothetical protein [Paeniclostridium sordellii]
MSIDKLIYSDLMFGDSRADDDFEFESDINNEFENNIYDDLSEESILYEKEFYKYIERLQLIAGTVNLINMKEVNLIVEKWKTEEAVKYLYRIIDNLTSIQ